MYIQEIHDFCKNHIFPNLTVTLWRQSFFCHHSVRQKTIALTAVCVDNFWGGSPFCDSRYALSVFKSWLLHLYYHSPRCSGGIFKQICQCFMGSRPLPRPPRLCKRTDLHIHCASGHEFVHRTNFSTTYQAFWQKSGNNRAYFLVRCEKKSRREPFLCTCPNNIHSVSNIPC